MHDIYLNPVTQLLTMVVKKEDKFRKGMRGCCEKPVTHPAE